jgi:acetyl esterase/lipase
MPRSQPAPVDGLRAAGVQVEHVAGPGLVHGYLGLGHVSAAAEVAGAALFTRFGRLLGQCVSARRGNPAAR